MRYAGKMSKQKIMPYVRIDGSGDQVIVFLHGFMSSKNYWRRVIRQLDMSEYAAISIDLLGFNKAPKPDSAYDYDEQITHIRDVLAKLGLEDEPVILVGHSMGALIAGRYAAQHPNLVKSVGLINPPIYTTAEQATATLLATGPHYRFLLASKYRGLLWAAGRYVRIFPKHSAASREKSLKSIVMAAEFLEDITKLPKRSLLTIGTKDRWLYKVNIELAGVLNLPIDVRIDETGHHAALTHPSLVAGYVKTLATQ